MAPDSLWKFSGKENFGIWDSKIMGGGPYIRKVLTAINSSSKIINTK